jgi:hypothetical protein
MRNLMMRRYRGFAAALLSSAVAFVACQALPTQAVVTTGAATV